MKLRVDTMLRKAALSLKRNDPEQAAEIYGEILRHFPANEKARRGLALVEGLKLKTAPPDIVDKLLRLAEEKQYAELSKLTTRLIDRFPDDLVVWHCRALAENNLQNLDEAYLASKKVTEVDPTFAPGFNNLGVLLRERGYPDEAVRCHERALVLKPEYAEAFINMGAAMHDLGRNVSALKAYRKALTLCPDAADAYANLGMVYSAQGEFDKSITSHKKALEIQPGHASAHRSLSSLVTYKSGDDQINTVEKILRRADLPEGDRCQLLYTYAKMQEDIGNFGVAFESYSAGGKLRRRRVSYNDEKDRDIFNDVIKTSALIRDIKSTDADCMLGVTPIFIVGMPRSGTTLIEQILSCHSNISAGGELPYVNRFGRSLSLGKEVCTRDSISEFRSAYLTELEKFSNGASFVTDKMPHNFLHIALMVAAIPEARFIHVTRDPAATCWSNFKQYFSGPSLGYSYDIEDTVRHFNRYKALMQHWELLCGHQIRHINYESLTLDQESLTRTLIDFVGVNWEESCLHPQKNNRDVSTASAEQVRKKVYVGSSEVWRKFEPFLNGAFDAIEAA